LKGKVSGNTTASADIATQSQKNNVSFPCAKKVNIKDKDYSIRYAPNWSQISRQCKELALFKCCLCQRKAVETHHAVYQDAVGLIAGREIPGAHIFPLCLRHHTEAHKPENWIHHHSNPVAGNKTTSSYFLKLLNGWSNTLEKVNCFSQNLKNK
jgi:hypothetical protein